MISPLSSFLLLQGIETVALRVERHVENARKVGSFFATTRGWTGSGSPDFPRASITHWRRSTFTAVPCSLMSVGIKGGYPAAVKFHDALKLVTRLVNLGDAKSLACHPASTTHRQMSAEEQIRAGVLPELIRLSIGIEHIDDILEDLGQALAAAS